MARPGTDPAAPNAAATLRGLRVVALAVALALLALVIDARSRPAPPEPVVLLPVPPPPSRPFVPRPAPLPVSPPAEAEAASAAGAVEVAPPPGSRAPAAADGAAGGDTRPAAAAPGPGEAAPALPAPPPQPAPSPTVGTGVRDGVLAYQAGDYERALAIWRPLAEAGNARARFHLGALFLEGRVGPSDPAAAYRWLALAAEAGQAAALPLRDQAAARLSPETVAAIRRELGLPP